jgi:hypothetical protein
MKIVYISSNSFLLPFGANKLRPSRQGGPQSKDSAFRLLFTALYPLSFTFSFELSALLPHHAMHHALCALPYLFHLRQLPFQQLPILGSACAVKIQSAPGFDFPVHHFISNYHKNLRSSAIFPPFWRMRRLQKAV